MQQVTANIFSWYDGAQNPLSDFSIIARDWQRLIILNPEGIRKSEDKRNFIIFFINHCTDQIIVQ